VPELGPLGSVRGVSGNGHPYRDCGAGTKLLEPTLTLLQAILFLLDSRKLAAAPAIGNKIAVRRETGKE
jgi:hypothetical protein